MTRRLPILTFHAIEDDPSPIAFPPPLFRDFLRAIDRHSCQTLSLGDAVAGLARRETLPERAVVLTFDDGYRSVYDQAFPLLRALRMTATIFLSAGGPAAGPERRLPPYAGRELMSWEEVREMSAAGIEFGAHTETHPDLTRLPEAELIAEVRGGKEEIERATGTAVVSFAYPFGRWNARVRGEAMRHYACACSDRLALAAAFSDRYALPRVDAYYLRSPRRARLLFSRFLPLYLWARNVPRTTRRHLAPPRHRKTDPCASA